MKKELADEFCLIFCKHEIYYEEYNISYFYQNLILQF